MSLCDVVSISASVPPSNVALLWKNLSVYDPNSRRVSKKADVGGGGSPCWPFGPKRRHEERRILKGLNGVIQRKSLNAIMGPSGSGKTTLLKCLFGTSSLRYSGQLFVGEKGTRAVFITQNEEDHLLLNLTVEESIRFASKVKNSGRDTSTSCSSCRCVDKCGDMTVNLVNSLIEQLDLDRCRHTLVNKCSGGQKKRLAIAQELASNEKPHIIFMDEPTSGIDSSVSYMVLKQLQALSQRNGIAIVATIHQPSYKILELFDQLYILSRRGKAIYQGRPQYLRPHLLRYSLQCPDGHNPADVIIELASTVTRREPGDSVGVLSVVFGRTNSKNVREHSPVALPSSEVQRIETLEKVAEIECEERVAAVYPEFLYEARRLCSYQVPRSFCHIWYLFRRCLVNSVFREPKWLLIRFTLHLLVAFILSFLYDDTIGQADGCLNMSTEEAMCRCSPHLELSGLRGSRKTAKNVSFLFFNLLFLMFASVMPTVLTFPAEMKVFLNEHRNGWYNTRSYYWAKSGVEFLVQLPLPYLYSMYMYWWTAQPGLDRLGQAIPFFESSKFKQFSWIMLLATFISQGVGFLIGALFANNFNISIFVATIFMLFNFLFAGFFIRVHDMGSVEFLTKLSFIRFSFEAMLLTIYGDGRCGAEVPIVPLVPATIASRMAALVMEPPRPTMDSLLVNSTATASPNFVSTVLYQFELDTDQSGIFARAVTWLVIHLILWRLLTYLSLCWKVSTNSPSRKIFFFYYGLKKASSRRHCVTLLFCLMIALVIVGAIIVVVV